MTGISHHFPPVCFWVLGMEFKASSKLSTCSTTELYPHPHLIPYIYLQYCNHNCVLSLIVFILSLSLSLFLSLSAVSPSRLSAP
jgi:hypothetical protein